MLPRHDLYLGNGQHKQYCPHGGSPSFTESKLKFLPTISYTFNLIIVLGKHNRSYFIEFTCSANIDLLMICLVKNLKKSFTICEYSLKLPTTIPSHFYWQITWILKATYTKFYINFLSTYIGMLYDLFCNML